MEEPFTIRDLRSALNRLLDAVEQRFGPEFSPSVDHYWNVPVSAAFDLADSLELDMGQVSDDVESIRAYARSSDSEVTAIWHECEHAAGLLRAIAFMDTGPATKPSHRRA